MEVLPVSDSLVVYDPRIAKKLKSIPQAIILQRIVWSINKHIEVKDERFFRGGRWWMYDTWVNFGDYSGLGRKQILLALKKLKDTNLVFTAYFESKNLNHTTYYSLEISEYLSLICPECRKGTIDSAETVLSKMPKGDYRKIQKGTIDSAETVLSKMPKGDLLTKSLTKTPPNPLSKNLTKRESSLSQILNPANQVESGETPPEPWQALSGNGKRILYDWHAWAQEQAPSTKWELSSFFTAIMEIKKIRKCKGIEIEKLIQFLKSKADPRISTAFISPAAFNKRWGDLILLDAAFLSMDSHQDKKQKEEMSEEETQKELKKCGVTYFKAREPK